MKKNVKIDENYFLTTQAVQEKQATVQVRKNTNHIFVVDVSGSMYYDLPKIRTQLKNKLSNLMKEGDTISIVWFSGRNEAGILKEEVEVKSLKTLTDLHDAIDRWLRPVCLTAFLKPLQLVKDLINRVQANRPDSVCSMIFLTDGYNNDCPWNEVISTLKSMESQIASSTFVEYGYYADSRAITQMASVIGGEKISCDGFNEFEPLFDAKISSSAKGGKKKIVDITDGHLYDFAFSVSDGSVLLYNITDGQIMVGGDVENVYFFSAKAIGETSTIEDDALYGAIYLLADKLLNDDAEKLFYVLGDNYHYKMLVNAFGKQKLNAFKASIKECVVDTAKRFPSGKAKIEKVPDDAYCFMDLIKDLGEMDCLFYPGHPDFNYERIGRKKVAVGSTLSADDQKRLSEAKNVDEANEILKELEEKKVDVKFVATDYNKGYPLRDLVWNGERANLSVLVVIDGKAVLPNNNFGIDEVATIKFNTFTIVKDGIVNIKNLPVGRNAELEKILTDNDVHYGIYNAKDEFDNTIFIDLTSLPIVNKKMVQEISANELAKQEWELHKIKGTKKVYDFYKKMYFPKESKSFVQMYGKDAADWLKEVGITDYNGFAPKTTFEEAKDFYMSVNLATKIKGLSSLPKVDVVLDKIKEGKSLKINEWVMSDALKRYIEQIESDMYTSLSEEQQKGVLKTYLETKSDLLNKRRRKIMQEIAQIKFSLILSKKWFKEFKSFDENILSLNLDGQDVTFTFDLSEKEVKI